MSLRRAERSRGLPRRDRPGCRSRVPKGLSAMRLRDELGAVYDDRMFASL